MGSVYNPGVSGSCTITPTAGYCFVFWGSVHNGYDQYNRTCTVTATNATVEKILEGNMSNITTGPVQSGKKRIWKITLNPGATSTTISMSYSGSGGGNIHMGGYAVVY